MHPVVHKGRFWKVRRRDRLGAVRALLRAPPHPGRRPSRRSCSTSRPGVPTSSAARSTHRQPPPRRARLRRHRHRLLRRLDVRPDVVRVRLPADGLPRVPVPAHRGLPRGRAVEPAEAEPRAAGAARKVAIKAAKWSVWTVIAAADVRRPSSPTSPAGDRCSRGARDRPARVDGRPVRDGVRRRRHPLRLRLVPRPDVHDRVPVRPPAERAGRPGHDPGGLRREARRPEGEAERPPRRRPRRRLHRLPGLRERLPDRHRHPARPPARVHRHGAVHRRLRRGHARAGQADRPHPSTPRSGSSRAAPGASGGRGTSPTSR